MQKKSTLPLNDGRIANASKKKVLCDKEELVKLLRWNFGYSDFRGKQLDAIQAVLSGRDCFCLMPTGGGKSMCYQIPALAKKTGIVLVVCPLIALMLGKPSDGTKGERYCCGISLLNKNCRCKKQVRYKDLLDDAYADLSNTIKSMGDVCAIVYCLERSMCDDLSLRLSHNGISCAAYHAGLNNKVRTSVLDDWISSKIQVVVATVAFGMGIDRKDVRIVCHFNIPKSMEAFYQESGRAGRDQLPSTSLLYYGVDDRKKMEFILRNSGSKKLQSSSSQQDSSKRSLAEFNQMVEYCDGSGCRRKRILESFGEQVTASLCGKTCDACRHPNLVARYLEDLKTACVLRQKIGSSPIFMTSSTDRIDREQSSEFWNRGDEASGSEEEISDSDDGNEVVNNLTRSKVQSRSGVNAKLAFLQRAEENFYRNKDTDKQRKKVENNAISDTMRGASRQRLQNALKQAQQRLDNFKIEVETSASLLEEECYKKYGKVGKSFYYSQVASTVRWLTTTTPDNLINRLGAMNVSTSISVSPKAENSLTPSPALDPNAKEDSSNELPDNARLETAARAMPTESSSFDTKLPEIPSFSEFVNSRKEKRDQLKDTKKYSSRVEKKMRLE
ncbi:PREDICTED: ATP-dependent DNA helicase Q-like 3 isoform X8 [Lupinus angustifolius]|uniref:ATP-dependent DNA helicase Q-like 3 isoform X8 n=1 Tax=Lupinus angustifolius TaxID=3871 RepID=UPI00092F0C06|nr:PREDICTED: ATP-dependent DNA helicase Q-like 3 isoform X8 [Lupinus angustifolius]